ncbi:MAG TPA: hypothetical protein VFJ97_11675 [Dermatophilaceae bacterium]|nr:hypothetical protein [Dermatophilaceae bacterium]
MAAGYGLSVRWSLAEASPDAPARLREYVVGTSLAKYAVKAGLSVKIWRMREGEWFEGTYVWATKAARDKFAETFAADAVNAVGTQIIGTEPSIEPFEVVGVTEGPAGFSRGPGPGE